jgi:hypothetical protein
VLLDFINKGCRGVVALDAIYLSKELAALFVDGTQPAMG